MARQSTYIKDGTVQQLDKWLITDYADGATKNLTVEDLGQFFAKTGAADPSRVGFHFTNGGVVPNTNITAVPSGTYYYEGTTTFASVSTLYISTTDLNGIDFLPISHVLNGAELKLTDISNTLSTAYGLYEVVTTDTNNDGFLILTLRHLGSHSSTGSGVDLFSTVTISAISSSGAAGITVYDDNTPGIGPHVTTVDGVNTPIDGDSFWSAGDLFFSRIVVVDPGTQTEVTQIRLFGPYDGSVWGEPVGLTGIQGFQGVGVTNFSGNQDGVATSTTATTVTVTGTDPGNPSSDPQQLGTFDIPSGVQGVQGTSISDVESDTPSPVKGDDQILTFETTDPISGTGTLPTTIKIPSGVQGDQGLFYLTLFKVVAKTDPTPSAPEGVIFNETTGFTNLPIDLWYENAQDHDSTNQSVYELRQSINPATAYDDNRNITFTAASWGAAFVAGDRGERGVQGPRGYSITGISGDTVAQGEETTVTVTLNDPNNLEDTFTVPSGVQGIQGESIAPFTPTADPSNRETDFIVLGTEGTSLSTFSIPWGEDGTDIYSQSGTPADSLGEDGDVYINSFNGDVFTKASGTWGNPTGNITGPRGLQGTSISAGSGVPLNSDGNEGDVFIDVSTGFVYNKGASVWTSVVGENLKGPQGETGNRGTSVDATYDDTAETLTVTETSYTGSTSSTTTIVDGVKITGADAGVVISKGTKVGLDQPVTFTPTADGTPDPSGAQTINVLDGNQGAQGLYQVFVYQRADSTPDEPDGGEWNPTTLAWTTLPDNWFADPSGDSTGLHVYESYALFDPANPTATLQWATPFVAGAQGATGANATLVGDGVAGVTTVPNKGDGTVGDATVTQSGNAQNIDFTFGIPQGIKGDPGTAATVDVGNTVTLSSGSTASVTNTGDTTNAVFNFGIPIGLPGAAAGFGTITAATGPIGVVETGPDTAKNLAFTIPAGERGESIEVDESATVTTATETTVTLRTTDTNTLAGTFDVQRGIQGAQGFYNAMVYTVAPNPGANVPTPDSGTGSGITTPPTHAGFTWSFTPPSTTGSEVIFISTAVFNPLTPTDALAWSQPYLASGGTGVQGPQGVQGPPGIQGPRGLRGFDGVQGVQGLYNLFIYRIAPTDSIPANIQPVLGSGIVAAPADWSFDPVSTTVPDGMSIWISSGLYNPAIPQAAIDWGLPFIASGEPGVPGPQGPAGTGIASGGTLGYALVSDGNELGSAWAEFTTGYNASHQQIGFLSNGTTILASVDLSGFTPLTPSGGGPTTSNMYSSVGTAAPTTFDITAMTDNGAATHQKSIALPYNDQSGTVEQWALIAIPNDLIGSGTVRFSAGGAFDIPPDGTLTNGTANFTGYYFQFFEAFTVIIYVD